MGGNAMTIWLAWGKKNITVLNTTPINLQTENCILTELKIFWGIAKNRLAKFRGFSKSNFYLQPK
jgi:hypothetical protein